MDTYDTVYAPPATVFLHDLQSQIPTECLLTVVFPQNVQTYLACCVISIFLTCFLSEAPYLNSRKQLVSYLMLDSMWRDSPPPSILRVSCVIEVVFDR